VFAQLFNCFNARSDRTSAFHGFFANRWLWAAIAVSAALQVAVVQLPFLNDAFDTEPLSVGGWLLCVGLSAVVLLAGEAWKAVSRAVHRDESPGSVAQSGARP
jgi:magnesium-transporting ATPase (P-type)